MVVASRVTNHNQVDSEGEILSQWARDRLSTAKSRSLRGVSCSWTGKERSVVGGFLRRSVVDLRSFQMSDWKEGRKNELKRDV